MTKDKPKCFTSDASQILLQTTYARIQRESGGGGSSVRGVGWGLEILNFLNLIKNYPKHALDSPHPLPPPAKLRHPSSWNNFLDPHMMLHVTVPVDLALLINHILVHFFISVLVLCT